MKRTASYIVVAVVALSIGWVSHCDPPPLDAPEPVIVHDTIPGPAPDPVIIKKYYPKWDTVYVDTSSGDTLPTDVFSFDTTSHGDTVAFDYYIEPSLLDFNWTFAPETTYTESVTIFEPYPVPVDREWWDKPSWFVVLGVLATLMATR
jgi:hypothetical protein